MLLVRRRLVIQLSVMLRVVLDRQMRLEGLVVLTILLGGRILKLVARRNMSPVRRRCDPGGRVGAPAAGSVWEDFDPGADFGEGQGYGGGSWV